MTAGAVRAVVSESEDADLVARARAGDRIAFGRLLAAHYDAMYRIAYRWCGHREDAEDIAQDVAIKLASAIRSFDGRSAFSSWLYRIVLNAVRDRQRQGARRRAQSRALSHISPYSAAPEQEAGVEDEALWAAVRVLPEKQRDAVLLVYAEEMTHAGAAAVMGVKEGTVSWYLSEARKALGALV